MIGAALTLAVFGVVGLAISRLLGIEQVLLGGMGATGVLLFLAGVLGLPLIPTLLVILTVAVVVVLVVRERSDRSSFDYPILPTVISLFGLVWLSALALTLPLNDYDGRAFWLLKAKAISYELDVDGPFFHDLTSMSPRNEYPLLVPLDAAVVMLTAGESDDRHVRFMFVLYGIGFALAIRSALARIASPAIGAWAAALFIWFPQIGPEADGGMLTGSADIALGAFVACAFFELLEARSAWRFGFWLPMILLTKNEGLPLALLLFLLGCWVFRKKAVISAIFVAAGVGLLGWWRSGIAPSDESDHRSLIWSLPDHLDLFHRVLGDFASQMWALHDWGLFWLAVAVAAIWLAVAREWRLVGLGLGLIAPVILLYSAVIAVTDWELYLMTDSVAPRLMTHLLGPGMALLGLGLITASRSSDTALPR